MRRNGREDGFIGFSTGCKGSGFIRKHSIYNDAKQAGFAGYGLEQQELLWDKVDMHLAYAELHRVGRERFEGMEERKKIG